MDKIRSLSMDLLKYGKYAEISCTISYPNLPVIEAAAVMNPRTAENNIELTIDLSPDLVPFYFDPEAVQRCILNLWANAIDACIDAQPSGNKQQLIIRTKKVDAWGCEYTVSDTGKEMDASIRTKILDLMRTAHATGKGNRISPEGDRSIQTAPDRYFAGF